MIPAPGLLGFELLHHHGEPVTDATSPGLQRGRSQTDQARSLWPELSSVHGKVLHALEMCCLACVCSVRALDTSRFVCCLLVGCLSSQQHASVSQGRICTDNFTCCHTEIEAADQTFHLTQSQYTDTGPTSPSADPITPGAWQGSHWSANF